MTTTPAEAPEQAQGNPDSWFTNKEWALLVTAIGIAAAGIVAATMTPSGAIASASVAPSAAPTHVCAKPTTAAAETASAVTTTPTSAEATTEPTATPAATASVDTRVSSSTTKRTTTTKVAKKTATKPATAAPKKEESSLFSAGLVVDLGSYKGNPLRWLVLDSRDDELLLLSESVISAGAFRSDWESADANRYSASEVRSWLTGTFKGQAFSDEQQQALIPHAGGITNDDSVFLLSASEVRRYLPSRSDRQAVASDSASGAGFSGEDLALKGGHAQWWLADPASGNAKAQTVNADGSLSSELVYYADLGVRPAIRVDRSKVDLTLVSQRGN